MWAFFILYFLFGVFENVVKGEGSEYKRFASRSPRSHVHSILNRKEVKVEDGFPHLRAKRQALVRKWEKVIPYSIVDENVKEVAEELMKMIMAETCIKFKERSDETDYVQFVDQDGCFSKVGKVGGAQSLSISPGCQFGTITHELFHTLGLWHEQARYDRDQYVKIMYDNVEPDHKDNFQKKYIDEGDVLNLSYDYGSIMHYGPKNFAIGSSPTIKTVDPRYQHTIGQREDVAFTDLLKLNALYCPDSCKTTLSCKHGGYTNPNDCTKCKCPEGLSGTLCEETKQSDFSVCGATDLEATSDVKTLSLSGVLGPGRCVYRIRTQSGSKVQLKLKEHDFDCEETCRNFVEVKHSKDKSVTGFRMCCDEALGYKGVSEDEEMIVIVNLDERAKPFNTKLDYNQVKE